MTTTSDAPGAGEHSPGIDALLAEGRTYPPPAEFARSANAQPDLYRQDPDEFWAEQARQRVTWFTPFSELRQWDPPHARWFLGGQLNVCHNCVDRHVDAGRGATGRLLLGGRAR